MTISRVASATTAILLCVTVSSAAASVVEVQYRAPAEQTAPAEPKAQSSEREPRIKERTPPPRPIVPPEGQQQNPALREDCAWLGQRIVSLLVRDDPMTGNDFVPFFQRFGCPQEHLSKAFGCVVSFEITENEALADRVAQCWTDPAKRPTQAERTPAAAPDGQKDPADVPNEPKKPTEGGNSAPRAAEPAPAAPKASPNAPK